MAEFERRVCDYCLAKSSIVRKGGERLTDAGWTEVLHDGEWLDRCPVCTFADDTAPIPKAER